MKQAAQQPRTGDVRVIETPEPNLRPGWICVENHFSVISAGTERGKIELGKKNLLAKAQARPDLVKKTFERARVEGIRSTAALAKEHLAGFSPLGYSSSGIVVAVAPDVPGFAVGDRVACGGGGWANHASVVSVPWTLAAQVPDGVDLADAAYATIGAIALHAVRQADARVGEAIGVIGLGLVGQLAVRVLAAAGCRTVGLDVDPVAVELASIAGGRAFTRDDPGVESAIKSLTSGIGLDGVLICAASRSVDPLTTAIRLSRDRGTVVVVGDVPIKASRAEVYEKEIQLRISRSYGPGRYMTDYEQHGVDLPAQYVRWTEQRNIQAFVDLVESGAVRPSADLTTHRFPIDAISDAYTAVSGEGSERAFGVLIEYDPLPADAPPRRPDRRHVETAGRLGLIGVGSFARGVLLPALEGSGLARIAVSSESGLSAADAVARLGFQRALTTEQILGDDSIDSVIVCTRHASHAEITAQALRAGKAVFVEKPLALNTEELDEIVAALPQGKGLMVGFNRRHARDIRSLRQALGSAVDLTANLRVNAGALEQSHWLHDPKAGGGRLLGEGCHFVDLALYILGGRPVDVHAAAISPPDRPIQCADDFIVTVRTTSGVAAITYSGSGDPRLGKERVEVFGGGMSIVIDDFRRLLVVRGGKSVRSKHAQDKGHREQMRLFGLFARGREPWPDPTGYISSTSTTLAAAESLLSAAPVPGDGASPGSL